uniref:Chitin-binding type-2 domain-containing protein n=1 Tax=Panagrolaimus sp. ES5 TaxID=591445 RepID=A0AC34GRS2_9BILA
MSSNEYSLSKSAPIVANHENGELILDQPVEITAFSTTDSSLLKTAPLLTNGEYGQLVPDKPIEAMSMSPTGSTFVKAAPMLANHENIFDDDKERYKAAPLSTDDSSLLKAAPFVTTYGDDRRVLDQPIEAAPMSSTEYSFSKSAPIVANHESDELIIDQPVKITPFSTSESSLLKAAPLVANRQNDRLVIDKPIEAMSISATDPSYVKAAPIIANYENVLLPLDQHIEAVPMASTESLLKSAPLNAQYEDDLIVLEQPVYRPKSDRVADEFDRNAPVEVIPKTSFFVDRFEGEPVPQVLTNAFASEGRLPQDVADRFDGESIPQVLNNVFASDKQMPLPQNSLVVDHFEGKSVPQVLNNAFAHFSEEHRPKYQRNVQLMDEDVKEGSGSGLEDSEDIGLFWRKKRSIDAKNCPVKQYSYRPMFRRFNVTSSHIPHIRTVDSSVALPSLREMFDNAPDVPPAVDPECYGRENGYTYSSGVCRSAFHRCFNGAKIRHSCAQTGQVYDEYSKVCVPRADSIECRPPKPIALVQKGEFDEKNLCKNHVDGLYRHPTSCHRIIQCFGNDTFEHPSCEHELAFDESRGICDYRQNVPGCETYADGTSSKHQSVIGCGGNKHGDYIPNEKDCNSFYRCVWDILEMMRCPSGTVFNPKINVCDYPNQVQCNAAN